MGAKEDFLAATLMVSKMPGRVPVLSPFLGGDYYYMRDTIYWTPDGNPDAQKYKRVDVAVGFVTDLTSVPSVFWSVLPKDGIYLHAAIVHDYSYWVQTGTREEADDVLRIGMAELGVPSWQITSIYEALQVPFVGGARAWAANQELKKAGERRILKRYPDDPRTTWEIWKSESDVFLD